MSYASFFAAATGGRAPFPYQARLAEGPWPTLLDVPTGLGKTAAVVVAWLYRRCQSPPQAPARLVYCLPMRSLVEQTTREARAFIAGAAGLMARRGLAPPPVHVLMGGAAARGFDEDLKSGAILVGTQDQLLSRALNRGYGASRFRWPMEFAALHNDALWVFDETQLMGVGVQTGAQLEGLRRQLGAFGDSRSLWMSATLERAALATVDHPEPPGGWPCLSLGEADRAHPVVAQRLGAAKALSPLPGIRIAGKRPDEAAPALARAALAAHRPGSLTLIVVNRVARAQALYAALRAAGRGEAGAGLIHSRFRSGDRARHMALLEGEGDRVVVATQAIEAGVDVSARTLITELAPWPSLVQRFGRCNRQGAQEDAAALWVDVDDGDRDAALPYEGGDLAEARGLLERAAAAGGAGPAVVSALPHTPEGQVLPTLRRRDLLDLFDTTPDLAGADLDVSRFIRDSADADVQVFWRDLGGAEPPPSTPAPAAGELCRVSVAGVGALLKALDARKGRGGAAASLTAWRWDAAAGAWRPEERPRPGHVLLLDVAAGGYSEALGFTGDPADVPTPVAPVAVDAPAAPEEGLDDDPGTRTGVWVGLGAHLRHVEAEARALVAALPAGPFAAAVVEAAAFHDVGKAHPVFQAMLTQAEGAAPPGQGPWAKADHQRGRAARRGFRHELASALAWLERAPADHPHRDLVAYLVAAHHGKVRLSIRAFPGEEGPEGGRGAGRYARGVWEGDRLPGEGAPPVILADGAILAPIRLDLGPMGLGAGSWVEKMLALRDDPELGPFRLAWLETLVRLADWRASGAEARGEVSP